ncbi:MAG: carboxyl transferase domain-containing protein, partial [Dehalococcoidales bacterium]|nr:carboxyl transferase domain-containing protein [Dehalococcoidales bacterium]
MDIKKLEEVEKKKQTLALGGGAAAVEKLHAKGKLSASERMDKLFDPGTFRELYRWAKPLKTGFDIDEIASPRAGMVAGYGEIEGRAVYSAAFDFTVHGGSQNAMQMVKLGKVMQQAREEGVPFVGIVDSGGRQIQDLFGPWGLRPPTRLHGYEEAFDMFCPPMASGVIPQVSLMLGPCYAGTAYSPIMSDFVFFRKETSFMSLASPALLKSVTFVDVTQDEIGGAVLHATTTGSCDLLAETDEEALAKCRQLLGFLPSNWREKPPFFDCGDAPNRREERLLEVVPGDPSKAYDIHQVISLLVDKGDFFELAAMHAGNMVIGYARLAGQPVGIVANNPAVADGAIDVNACDKAARFIRTCDCFSVPLLFLVDTP